MTLIDPLNLQGTVVSADALHTQPKWAQAILDRLLRTSCELNDYLASRWPQVAQVFQLERTVTRQGKTAKELVYGLTSLTPQQASPLHLLSLVRQHWHIENRAQGLPTGAAMLPWAKMPVALPLVMSPLFLPHSTMPSWRLSISSTCPIWPRPSAFLMPIPTQRLSFFSSLRLLKPFVHSYSTFARP